MGFGSIKRRAKPKAPATFAPVADGEGLALFGEYLTVEGIDEAFRQAELSSLRQGLKEHLDSGNEELQIDLGITLELFGETEAAKKELTTAEQQLPDNASAPYALARFLMEAAPEATKNTTKQEGRWSIIVSHLRKTIQLDPNNIAAHYHLGNAIRKLVEEESYVDVVEVYTKYLAAGTPLGYQEDVQNFINEQNPDKQREAAFARGRETLERQKYAESITAFATAAELGELEAFYYLGKVHAITGAYGKAADAYQQAIKAGFDKQEVREAYGQAVISMFCDLAPLSLGLHMLDRQKQNKRIHAIGQDIFKTIQPKLPHRGEIATAIFSPDNKTMVSGATDGYVKFWDISQGTISDNLCMEPLPPIVKLCYSSDMQFIAVATVIESAAGNQHEIGVYDLTTKTLVNSYNNKAADYLHLDFICANDEIIISEYDDNKKVFLLKKWDFKTKQVVQKDSVASSSSNEEMPKIIKFSNEEDGQFLLTAVFDINSIFVADVNRNPYKLVHIKKGDLMSGLTENLETSEIITFSEDKKLAFVVSENQAPQLLTSANGIGKDLKKIKGKINAVCFSPDNKFILTTITDNVIALWRIEKEIVQQWQQTISPIRSMAFSPDGKLIILGLRDASLMLFDVEGNQLQRFPFVGFPGWQPLKRKKSTVLDS